jgi:hypothetical protein
MENLHKNTNSTTLGKRGGGGELASWNNCFNAMEFLRSGKSQRRFPVVFVPKDKTREIYAQTNTITGQWKKKIKKKSGKEILKKKQIRM